MPFGLLILEHLPGNRDTLLHAQLLSLCLCDVSDLGTDRSTHFFTSSFCGYIPCRQVCTYIKMNFNKFSLMYEVIFK